MEKCNRNKELFSQSRQMIYDSIMSSPGIHLRKLSRMLKISKTTVSYHLRWLERQEYIFHNSYGNYHQYYSSDVGSKEAVMLSFLRKTTSRIIILFLLNHPYASQVDISRSIGKHPTTVEFYLKKLLEHEIIKHLSVVNKKIFYDENETIMECIPEGNGCFYTLVDPFFTCALMKKYKLIF